MALQFISNRCRSTSDILDEIMIADEKFMENPVVENRFKTYTCRKLEEEKKTFEKELQQDYSKEKKRETAQKSHNFVKKLIAALEKKNGACKADDEFFTRYYKRNDYSNPNSDYIRDMRIKNFKRTEIAENFMENPGKEENPRCDTVFKNKVISLSDNRTDKQFLTRTYDKKILDRSRDPEFGILNEEMQNICQNRNPVEVQLSKNFLTTQEMNIRNNFHLNKIDRNERKFHDNSSFDPTRVRVEFQYELDSLDSSVPRKDKNNRGRNTLERIFINSREESEVRRQAKKKLNQRRSFKEFLGSIVKWRKSESTKMEKPRRFMSCDRLTEETNFHSGNSNKLSKTSSLQTITFDEYNETISMQINERNATIHPAYGGKRNEKMIETYTRRKENGKYFAMTAIKDTTKCLSELPEKLQINDFHRMRRKSISEEK